MLALAAALMSWHAADKSSAYDEVQHIGSGFYYWTHLDFARGLEHPPLVRLLAALPLKLLALNDPETLYPVFANKPLTDRQEFLYGMLLVYQNKVGADRVLFLSRAMVIAMTLGLFWLCWRWSTELHGGAGGLLTLFLLCTLPPLLGHGSLATTDAGGVAGAVLSLYWLSRYLRNPQPKNLLLAGLGLGVAYVTKLYNLILGPLAAAAILIDPGKKQKSWKDKTLSAILLLIICAFVINLCHLFQEWMPPHNIHPRDLEAYGWPVLTQFIYRWLPLPDFYLMSVGFASYHSKAGFGSFWLGQLYERGVWHYFPILFWMKAPVISLAVVIATAVSFFKKNLEMEEKLILIVAAVFAALSIRSGLNLGIRHFLLIYVLLFILAGRLLRGEGWRNIIKDARKKTLIVGLAGLMVVFQIFEVLSAAPHFLAYFNWAVGGPSRGIRYANEFDLGQDLKRLGRFMAENPGAELVLSYFGTGLPGYYGMEPQELAPTGTEIHSGRVNSDRPQREFLAVSAAHLQGYMTGTETFAWLRAREPYARLGYSIYIYDITADADSHARLAALYRSRGETARTQRHLRRIDIIGAQIQPI